MFFGGMLYDIVKPMCLF